MNKLFILIIILISLFFIKNFLVNNNRFLEYNVENFEEYNFEERIRRQASGEQLTQMQEAANTMERRALEEAAQQTTLNELRATLEGYQANPPNIANIDGFEPEGVSGIQGCNLADIISLSPDRVQECINSSPSSLINQLKNNLENLNDSYKSSVMMSFINHLNAYYRETLKLLLSLEAGREVYNLNFMAKYKASFVLLGTIQSDDHYSNIRVVDTPNYQDCEEELIYKKNDNGCNWRKATHGEFRNNYNIPTVFEGNDLQGNDKFSDLRSIYIPMGFMAKITMGIRDSFPPYLEGKHSYDKTTQFRDGGYFFALAERNYEYVYAIETERFGKLLCFESNNPWSHEVMKYTNLRKDGGKGYSAFKGRKHNAYYRPHFHELQPYIGGNEITNINKGSGNLPWYDGKVAQHEFKSLGDAGTNDHYVSIMSRKNWQRPYRDGNYLHNYPKAPEIGWTISQRAFGHMADGDQNTISGGGEFDPNLRDYTKFIWRLGTTLGTNTTIPITPNGEDPKNLYLKGGCLYMVSAIKQYFYGDLSTYNSGRSGWGSSAQIWLNHLIRSGGEGTDGFHEKDIFIKEIRICRDPEFVECLLHKSTTDYIVEKPDKNNDIIDNFRNNIKWNRDRNLEVDYDSLKNSDRFKYFKKWSDIVCRYNTSSLPENRPEPSRWSSFNPENGYYKPNSDWKIKRHFT